jgi:hypothetical protein
MTLPGNAVCGPGAVTVGVNLLPPLVGPPFSDGVTAGADVCGAELLDVVAVVDVLVVGSSLPFPPQADSTPAATAAITAARATILIRVESVLISGFLLCGTGHRELNRE